MLEKEPKRRKSGQGGPKVSLDRGEAKAQIVLMVQEGPQSRTARRG